MRILSIDSSINNIGWAVLESDAVIEHGQGLLGSGTLRTKKKTDSERVFEIIEMINNLFKLNNQDFPEKPPILDIDPAQEPYSQHHAELLEQRAIKMIIIEKPEGFTYDKHISQQTGKSMSKKSIGQNNFAVGIIAAAVAIKCEQILFVSAQEWKGRTAKTITRLEVNNTFGLKLEQANNDESDAIGIGCWWIRDRNFKSRIIKSESQR